MTSSKRVPQLTLKEQMRKEQLGTARISKAQVAGRIRLPDGSRSVQSVWVWRGFLMMSILALGFCLVFAVGHQTFFAVAWGVIAAGWFTIAMWLWRKHLRWDDEEWRASQQRRRVARS
jgi:hypothetical protein